MNEENVIEICVGVGMNQIFPETIKIVIDYNSTDKPIKEKKIEKEKNG
jgi:hypothetical protein